MRVVKTQPPISGIHVPDPDIFHNAKVELYPNVELAKVTYSRKKIFKDDGWELHYPEKRRLDFDRREMGENVRDDSLRRAKKRIFGYAMLNKFDYFVTWTLDAKLIDRYDRKEVAKKMQKFLNNAVQRKDLRYIIVPEFHKDGAIHAHGFASGNLNMVNSGKLDRAGRTIYNVRDWKWGFTTAVRISGDYQKASYYITKYVNKASQMIFGNFYYAGGRGLIRQPETLLFDAEFDDIEAKEYEIEEAKNAFKYEDVDRSDNP
jgi:hypothetical protein